MSLCRPLFVMLVVASLPLAAAEPTMQVEKGFTPLFDGKTLNGWTGAVDGYVVKDGAIVCDQKKGGNLFTEKEYADFVLRLDVQIPPDGNNGIGIRAPIANDVSVSGIEIQALDDPAEMYKTIKPWQHHGSVYGVFPAKQGSLRPAGQWNREEITVKGTRIRVVVNGRVVVDGDWTELAKNGTPDGKKHPGLDRTTGHIGFLGHGSPVAFRNIRIKELGQDDPFPPAGGVTTARRSSTWNRGWLRSLLGRLR